MQITDDTLSLAEQYINETGVSIFLTGKAGTGKTTFLKHIHATTSKRHVILAPTGVAAINAGGQTIHSFFQLPLCPYLPDLKDYPTEYQMSAKTYSRFRKDRINIIRTLDLLIIDEVSMVRADLLDAVDMTLRRYRRSSRPFGGVQLLLIGDVQQLSPVVTEAEKPYISQVYRSPYFFESKALRQIRYITIELTHIFRQKNREFVELLNGVRGGNATADVLSKLNSRLNADFNPDDSEHWIRLTTHNWQSDRVNDAKLQALPGSATVFEAVIKGTFPQSSYPAQVLLPLKIGEQVMFVRNDSSGKGRYYNGKIGIIKEIEKDCIMVICQGANGEEVIDVQPETWNNTQYSMNTTTGEIEQKTEGTFSQMPLRAAWAVTIHKSQGLTFDRVIIDASEAFAFGQIYVALSRCTTLEGIVLSSPIRITGIIEDYAVKTFSEAFTPKEALETNYEACHNEYLCNLMCECFSFTDLAIKADRVRAVFAESLKRQFPAQLQKLIDAFNQTKEMEEVGSKFANQIYQLSGNTEKLDERTRKGAVYFLPMLNALNSTVSSALSIAVNNKETAKKLMEQGNELKEVLSIKRAAMQNIILNGFSPSSYQKAKLGEIVKQQKSATTSNRTNYSLSRRKKK